jgi:hypothetical protein
MFYQPPRDEPILTAQLRQWMRTHPDWHIRQDESSAENQLAVYWAPNITHRPATADEIAEQLLNDEGVSSALTLLQSPLGAAVQDALLRLSLPRQQADLLSAGLTRAWQMASDQKLPAWQRALALAGGVGVAGIVIWAILRKR